MPWAYCLIGYILPNWLHTTNSYCYTHFMNEQSEACLIPKSDVPARHREKREHTTSQPHFPWRIPTPLWLEPRWVSKFLLSPTWGRCLVPESAPIEQREYKARSQRTEALDSGWGCFPTVWQGSHNAVRIVHYGGQSVGFQVSQTRIWMLALPCRNPGQSIQPAWALAQP